MLKRVIDKNVHFRLTIVPSSALVNHLHNNCVGVVAKDFIGYILVPDKKKSLALAVSVTGHVFVYSIDKKKPMVSLKKEHKFLNNLIKLGWLKYAYDDVYPEFEPYNNILLDPETAVRVSGKLFKGICYNGEAI